VGAVVEFQVFIRSRTTDRLHGIGTHTFLQPLIKGETVDFQGETWKVLRVHLERTPKVAVLELHVA
jgi:hypothetical protein